MTNKTGISYTSLLFVGVWRSLVARTVRDGEVGGSNPLTPTNNQIKTILGFRESPPLKPLFLFRNLIGGDACGSFKTPYLVDLNAFVNDSGTQILKNITRQIFSRRI